MNYIITGCAGFIGFHSSLEFLHRDNIVIGIDNLNDYYDVSLKLARLEALKKFPNFIFYEVDIINLDELEIIFKNHKPQNVLHLAAQAGVRYALKNPYVYIKTNVLGFTNVIDLAKKYEVLHFVYASTSSVYGANQAFPSKESDNTNHPLTIYAASKKANELIAHSYSHLYELPTTGLRFFTVYGPWGRPDMAFFSFTKNILANIPIEIYNNGKLKRDFTYIDDIIAGISCIFKEIPSPNSNFDPINPNPASSNAPYRLYNIGHGNPTDLLNYITELEEALNKKAIKVYMPMQKSDVYTTHADISLIKEFNYTPKTSIKEGIGSFVKWYKSFYDPRA